MTARRKALWSFVSVVVGVIVFVALAQACTSQTGDGSKVRSVTEAAVTERAELADLELTRAERAHYSSPAISLQTLPRVDGGESSQVSTPLSPRDAGGDVTE